MKRYLALVICSFLLNGPVSAQLTAEQQAEVEKSSAIAVRAHTLLLEAESRAMEQCNVARVVVPLPHFNTVTKTEITVDTIVSIEWSGACVDGRRDGDGVLTWIEEETTNTRINETTSLEIRSLSTWRSEGRFVKGRRLGLWCMTSKFLVKSKSEDFTYPPYESESGGCSVFAGHDRQLTDNYRKQSDGSWMNYLAGMAGGSSLAPGTLEAQSAKVLADAAAGKTVQAPELVVQNRTFDDLVRGSKIVLAPSAAPIPLKDKRVAIILSSRTISELERFKREREALISASSGLTGDAAKYRSEFIAASRPDRPLINLAKIVRKHARTVLPADDLVGLQKGEFDYALIVDWRHMSRFDLLGKYDTKHPNNEETPAPGCESWAAFLVTPDLKAVKELPASQQWCLKGADFSGDSHYMLLLSNHFQNAWGKSPDDTGMSMIGLDYFLKL